MVILRGSALIDGLGRVIDGADLTVQDGRV
jgi:hypothetical protein